MPVYDVVVVGAGHNGLIAASLLALHGLSVAVVDESYAPGGLAGGRLCCGLWSDRYAYVVGLLDERVLYEAGVPPTGLFHETDPSWVEVDEWGRVWFRWWTSREARLREFEALGAGRDYAEFEALLARFWVCMEGLGFYYTVSPPGLGEAAELLSRLCPGTEIFLEERARTVLSMFFPSELWGLLAYPFHLDENAYILAYFLHSLGVWRPPKGGMAGLASRLARAAQERGAALLLGSRVEEIIVRGSRAHGVRLAGGRVVEARRGVLYAASLPALPRLLAEPERLGEDAKRLEELANEKSPVVRVDIYTASRPEPPREEGWRGTPVYSIWGPWGGGEATYPTLLDPRGPLHLVQFSGILVEKPSPSLLEQALPGLRGPIEAVEARDWRSQERHHSNPTGNPNHIPMTTEHIMDKRPLRGWHTYTTPIEGLYHGSASSHPGGQVTGAPGLNAATRILLDNNVEPKTRLTRLAAKRRHRAPRR